MESPQEEGIDVTEKKNKITIYETALTEYLIQII